MSQFTCDGHCTIEECYCKNCVVYYSGCGDTLCMNCITLCAKSFACNECKRKICGKCIPCKRNCRQCKGCGKYWCDYCIDRKEPLNRPVIIACRSLNKRCFFHICLKCKNKHMTKQCGFRDVNGQQKSFYRNPVCHDCKKHWILSS